MICNQCYDEREEEKAEARAKVISRLSEMREEIAAEIACAVWEYAPREDSRSIADAIIGIVADAIADRSGNRRDGETRLGPKGESSGAEGNRP